MGGNNGFDGKPNNDYRVKIQLDDTQSGVLAEKLKAANGSGITLNVVDGGEDAGKVLEIDFDANNITLETKIVGGNNISVAEGTGAQAGKLVISETEAGKVLVDSNDTTLKYLDSAITSSDNSIQHEVDLNKKENLTVPNLGKVKYNNEFLNLAEGDGISLDKNGTDLEISATNNGKVFVNSLDQTAGTLTDKLHVESPLSGYISPGNNKVCTIAYEGVETGKIQLYPIVKPSNDTDGFNISGASNFTNLAKVSFEIGNICPAFNFVISPDLRENSATDFILRLYFSVTSSVSGQNKLTIKTEVEGTYSLRNGSDNGGVTVTQISQLSWNQTGANIYYLCLEIPVEPSSSEYTTDKFLYAEGVCGAYNDTETTNLHPLTNDMTVYMIGAEVVHNRTRLTIDDLDI